MKTSHWIACVAVGPRTRLNHLYSPYTEGLERRRRRHATIELQKRLWKNSKTEQITCPALLSLLKSVAFQILSLTFTIHQCHNFKSYKLQSWKVVKIFRDDAKSQRKTTTKFLEKLNYVPTANETDRTISLSKLNSWMKGIRDLIKFS